MLRWQGESAPPPTADGSPEAYSMATVRESRRSKRLPARQASPAVRGPLFIRYPVNSGAIRVDRRLGGGRRRYQFVSIPL